jgi:hypothetical protein
MTVPVIIRRPWVVPVIIQVGIVIAVTVAIIIPVIQVIPAAVTHPHPEITVIVIFIHATVLPIVSLFTVYIFIFGANRGIIYIIRCLTGFVSGCATADRKGGENCQK